MEADYLISLAASLATNISVLFLLSVGLAVVYGVRGVINLAHGEFVMLGAYCAVLGTDAGLPFLVTIPLAFAAVGAFGMVVERLLIRRLYGRLIDSMLATWGLGLILTQVIILRYGTTIGGMSIPLGNVTVGDYTLAVYNLTLVVVAAATFTVVHLAMTRTKTGTFVRATASSRTVAAGLGVDVGAADSLTFAFGAGLGGFAGAVLAPFLGVSPTMGQNLIGEVFLTVLVGGTREALSGVAAAATSLGTVNNVLSTWWAPVIGQVGLLLVAIAIVRVRGIRAEAGDR